MDGYRITIDILNVTEGDATGLAQSIWDENAFDFDAKLGEFKMTVSRLKPSASGDHHAFAMDWQPTE